MKLASLKGRMRSWRGGGIERLVGGCGTVSFDPYLPRCGLKMRARGCIRRSINRYYFPSRSFYAVPYVCMHVCLILERQRCTSHVAQRKNKLCQISGAHLLDPVSHTCTLTSQHVTFHIPKPIYPQIISATRPSCVLLPAHNSRCAAKRNGAPPSYAKRGCETLYGIGSLDEVWSATVGAGSRRNA
jgi:hypothetical protein